MLFLTWLAFIFIFGAHEELKERMSNPFTNWVDYSIPYSTGLKVSDIKSHYVSRTKDSFGIEDINGYFKLFTDFPSLDHSGSITSMGRSYKPEDEILKVLLDDDNALQVDTGHQDMDCGIILSVSFLEKMGIKPKAKIRHIPYAYTPDIKFYIPVIAVVRELPSPYEFFISERLYQHFHTPVGRAKFYTPSSDSRLILSSESRWNSDMIGDMVKSSAIYDIRLNDSVPVFNEQHLLIYEVLLDRPLKDSQQYDLITELRDHDMPSRKYYPLDCDAAIGYYDEPYGIAFNFNDLGKVRAFKEDISNRFKIDIDISQVEEKENFALLSRSFLILQMIFLFFSATGISLYIHQMLQGYFRKNRKNLGVFKAFGVSAKSLQGMYVFVITKMILVAVLLGLIAALLILLGIRLVLPELALIFDHRSIFLVATISAIGVINAYFTINSSLSATPGQMINHSEI